MPGFAPVSLKPTPRIPVLEAQTRKLSPSSVAPRLHQLPAKPLQSLIAFGLLLCLSLRVCLRVGSLAADSGANLYTGW